MSLVRLVATACLSLSTLGACGESKPIRIVTLNVEADGTYLLDGERRLLEELTPALKEMKTKSGKINLHIHASGSANHQAVARAVTAAQTAEIALLSFIAEPLK